MLLIFAFILSNFLQSQDSSEQTQDCDIQFKAKRDFLMSGLPDLLKRQIAKKAAALDAYNAASTSFQRVVHVQQKDDGKYVYCVCVYVFVCLFRRGLSL